MKQIILLSLAFWGGVFLAMQGSYNARLGVLLKNPLLATVVAFTSSTLFSLLFVFFSVKNIPSVEKLREVPFYLWFLGGFFSVLGISLYYYTIPKLGIATMISMGLCGQLVFSVLAGHYGWLSLPVEPITVKRTIGLLTMIFGILIMNWK